MATQKKVLPTYSLKWLDPKNLESLPAGVAFYNKDYGEYHLKIDEDPCDRTYYLKMSGYFDKILRYTLEQVIKIKKGKDKKRQTIGYGATSPGNPNEVHIRYGSKYKILVLDLREKNNAKAA